MKLLIMHHISRVSIGLNALIRSSLNLFRLLFLYALLDFYVLLSLNIFLDPPCMVFESTPMLPYMQQSSDRQVPNSCLISSFEVDLNLRLEVCSILPA
jgi:hypothetical protein